MQRFFQPINQLLRTICPETGESIARKIRGNFKANLKHDIAAVKAEYADVLHSPTGSLSITHWDDFKSSLHAWIDESFIKSFNSSDGNQRKTILTDINNKLLQVAERGMSSRLSRRRKRGVYQRHHQYYISTLNYDLPDAMYNGELHLALNQVKESISNNNTVVNEPGVRTRLL